MKLCFFQLRVLIEQQLPRLHFHFTATQVDTSMFAVGWFMTMFSSLETLPLDIVICLWDYILAMRWPGMMQVVLALLRLLEPLLLQCDFAEAVELLHKLPSSALPRGQALISCAQQFPVSQQELRRLAERFEKESPPTPPATPSNPQH